MLLNADLHFLTNRGTNFSYPGFPDNPDFVPRNLTAAQKKCMELMRLDQDYYARAVLMAMDLFPATRNVLESPITFRTDIAFPDDFGRLFAARESKYNYIWSDPAIPTYPVNINYTLEQVEEGKLLIKYHETNTSEVYFITESLSDSEGITYYRILHENDLYTSAIANTFGVKGGLPVGKGGQVNITYYPKHFPYVEMAAFLRANYENLMPLLEKPSLETTFLSTDDPIQVVALVGAALILSHLHVG